MLYIKTNHILSVKFKIHIIKYLMLKKMHKNIEGGSNHLKTMRYTCNSYHFL